MKMPSRLKINIRDVLAPMMMVVEVKGLKTFRIRLIIARMLMRLACFVMHFGLEFKNDRAGHNQPP